MKRVLHLSKYYYPFRGGTEQVARDCVNALINKYEQRILCFNESKDDSMDNIDVDVARKNPDAVFAIAGKRYETNYKEIPPNVYILGYVSDNDAVALLRNCRAFIFPSLYEGFGIPPLEALALGAEVIASNTSSLPEILGDGVHYVDPYYSDIVLEEVLSQKVGSKKDVLEKFDWKKSARDLHILIKDYISKEENL